MSCIGTVSPNYNFDGKSGSSITQTHNQLRPLKRMIEACLERCKLAASEFFSLPSNVPLALSDEQIPELLSREQKIVWKEKGEPEIGIET